MIAEPKIVSSAVDAEHPWPGLAPFTEELRGYFHGREQESLELCRRVQRKVAAVLFGQSGLGKTSLMQAGLLPKLRDQGYLPILIRLAYGPETPPLAEQVKSVLGRAWGITPIRETLWEHFHRVDIQLQSHDPRPVVLVFDQFEELFTLGQTSDAAPDCAAFLTELADLVENRVPAHLAAQFAGQPELMDGLLFDEGDVHVLLSLREDYLPHLEGLAKQIPSLMRNRMRLTRMTGPQALDAVLKPGSRLVSAEVARQIVRFVSGAARAGVSAQPNQSPDDFLGLVVEPALLSLVCQELNNSRIAEGMPRIMEELLGRIQQQILPTFYERCLADQPPAVRRFIEKELLTDSGFRDNVSLESALRKVPLASLNELVRRRLLHLENRGGVQRVELVHDVLTEIVRKGRAARLVKERESKLRRRIFTLRVGIIFVVLVVAAVLVFAFGQNELARNNAQEADRLRIEAEEHRQKAEKAEKEVEKLALEAQARFDSLYVAYEPIPFLTKMFPVLDGAMLENSWQFKQRSPSRFDITETYAIRIPILPSAEFRYTVTPTLQAVSKEKIDKAIGDFNAQIQLNPRNVDAFLGRGVLLSLKGEQKKGVADFVKAKGLDPSAWSATLKIGGITIYDRPGRDKAGRT